MVEKKFEKSEISLHPLILSNNMFSEKAWLEVKKMKGFEENCLRTDEIFPQFDVEKIMA